MKNTAGPLVVLLFAASIAVPETPAFADQLRIAFAEVKLAPAEVSQFCGECHDGAIAALPAVNRAGSHPVDRGDLTCLSCHRSGDPKRTPWRCAECHQDILYGNSQKGFGVATRDRQGRRDPAFSAARASNSAPGPARR